MLSWIHAKARMDSLAIKLSKIYIVAYVKLIRIYSFIFIYQILKLFFHPGYDQVKAKLECQAESMQNPGFISWLWNRSISILLNIFRAFRYIFIVFTYQIWKTFFHPGYSQAKAKLICQAASMQKSDWISRL